jgi:hypothetical protein
MIASLHLADLSPRDAAGALREQPRPGRTAGLHYADLLVAAALGPSLLPKPAPGRFGLLAIWDDDAALDAFAAGHPLARRLAGGWHARLEPLRATGAWTGMPALVAAEQPVDDDEPVAVLTYGRLRPRAALPFLRSSARAEGRALADPALLAGTGLARPPRTVATFSLWRSATEMRDYAYRHGEHVDAMRAMREHRFHSESLFARFRPYASRGAWDGRDPLARPAAVAA